MTIKEFYEAGGPAVSESTYEKIEDIYTAYNRFSDKVQIANFCREYGADGIEALMEPLQEYRSLKMEDDDIKRQISELEERIQKLKKEQEVIRGKRTRLTLQCDLSFHWLEWA